MSDIEEQNNNNASFQAFQSEFEEEEQVQNEAEDIPSLNWDALHRGSSMLVWDARHNPYN